MPTIKRVSPMQVTYMMAISSLVVHGYGVNPVLIVPPANQDQWIVVLLSSVYLVLLAFPLLFLANKFPDMTPIQYSVAITGKTLGKLFGFLFLIFLILTSASQVIMFELFTVTVNQTATPEVIIVAFIIPASIYAATKGIQSLGRLAAILAPVVFMTIVLFSLLGLNKMDFKQLLPVLQDSSLLQIQAGAFIVAARFIDLFILCMLVPNLREKWGINRSFRIYLLLVILFETLIVISTEAGIGVEQAKHSIGAYYLFIREIDVYDFIQRVESINVVMFYLSSFLRISVYLYLASVAWSQLFSVKPGTIWIIVIATMMFAITLVPFFKKIVSFTISQILLPYIQIPFFFILPFLLLIIYMFRRKSF